MFQNSNGVINSLPLNLDELQHMTVQFSLLYFFFFLFLYRLYLPQIQVL